MHVQKAQIHWKRTHLFIFFFGCFRFWRSLWFVCSVWGARYAIRCQRRTKCWAIASRIWTGVFFFLQESDAIIDSRIFLTLVCYSLVPCIEWNKLRASMVVSTAVLVWQASVDLLVFSRAHKPVFFPRPVVEREYLALSVLAEPAL